MRLPIPNIDEVGRFMDLYERKSGTRHGHEEAYDALSRIAQFIYLTEYESVRPLREDFARRGARGRRDKRSGPAGRRYSHPV